ncbi:hypothetical protein MVEN_00288800 [Mycena venus]|uniref:Uncharacterized protein n=1 Tax=Mycena venus TaxID=2733690 RepID=A0A8H7DFJ1_9AGAR|nr:hypothetical protein MVEN_00288800 [Mycena venus]
MPVPTGSHSASKPHFETIAASLDTTPALDPRHPLTERSLIGPSASVISTIASISWTRSCRPQSYQTTLFSLLHLNDCEFDTCERDIAIPPFRVPIAPSRLAKASCTTFTATIRTARRPPGVPQQHSYCEAITARLMRSAPTTSPQTPYPHPQHQAPEHAIRHAAGAVVPRRACCPSFDPRAQWRFTSDPHSWDVRHDCPCAAPAALIPRRTRSFLYLSPATTISAHPHSPARRLPLSRSPSTICTTTRVPRTSRVRSTCYRRSASPPFYSLPRGVPRPSSAGFRSHLDAWAWRIPSWTHTTTGVLSAYQAFLLAACHSLLPRSL